ncbi:hypothetical protein [Actinomycetospora chiangmaiensis]|uniref:hypothetical protein n=1 Tax=Actinomycetospora chiangmaiensis TaxID=402650 RepID=UPI0003766857|nr:hypothetical protein [Actinomycetospora chiangmaiensis]
MVLSGISLTMRLINGLLTVLSGITIAVIAVRDPPMPDRGWVVAAAVAWALYGVYILLTRRSYWVSNWFTYLIPIGAIVYLVASSK